MGVFRPPDFVEITVDSAPEYYSLSECWWHMMYGLKGIKEGQITYEDLDPVIGPCDPFVLSEIKHPVSGKDSVYRINAWWQHDYIPLPDFTLENIQDQMPNLYDQAFTETEVGPSRRPTGFPDRKVYLRKVQAFWNFADIHGNSHKINAGEMLYLFAKALYYHYNPPQGDVAIQLYPSHVLPKSYYEFLEHGRYKYVFGEGNQLKWFDLGQRWSMKPAVLS